MIYLYINSESPDGPISKVSLIKDAKTINEGIAQFEKDQLNKEQEANERKEYERLKKKFKGK